MTTVQDRYMKDIIAQRTARNILKEFIAKCGTQKAKKHHGCKGGIKMFIEDIEVFLLIAAIALCILLIIIELVDLVVFASYRKEYEKYQEEFSDDDLREMTEDGDAHDL